MRYDPNLLRVVWLALLVALTTSQITPLHAASPTRAFPGSDACRVPDSVAWAGEFAAPLAQKVPLDSEVRIVVLGSSSTAGTGASSQQTSFVERFYHAIDAQTDRRVRVINAGVSGNTTTDMLRRLRKDVIDRQPALVIWQTGVNDALQGVPIDRFARELAQGIAQIKTQNIPLVLVDQQDFIGAAQLPNYDAYVAVIGKIAHREQVTVLQRYRVMQYLSKQRDGGLQSLLVKDGLHMNDFAHQCIGELLAAGIGRLLG